MRHLALASFTLVVAAWLVTFFLSFGSDTDPRPDPALALDAGEFYVDPNREANRLVAQYPDLAPHANTPSFAWCGTWGPGPRCVRAQIDKATAAGKTAQVVVFNVEARECTDHAAARRYYDDVANLVGSHRVVIALEPDSLGSLVAHPKAQREACYDTLRYGISKLGALPNAEIYMEAASSRWWIRGGVRARAAQLRRIRVCRVDGIMANATHMHWTNENLRYLRRLDRLITGCRLRRLVNTSHNGQGPAGHWCDRGWHAGLGPTPRRLNRMEMVGYVNRSTHAQSCWFGKVVFHLDYARSTARRQSENFGP